MRAATISPGEARRRMRLMRKRVSERDVAHWAETFLGTLDRAPDTWPAPAGR